MSVTLGEISLLTKTQPWGARNLSFLDPDGNTVYLRSFAK